MIININTQERTFEINIDQYQPVHSYIKIVCPKDNPKYTILCMNEQAMTVEEYVELRRQTANMAINEYLLTLLQTGLKYVVFTSPILIIEHENGGIKDIKKRNVFIEIEKMLKRGELAPHAAEVADDQTDVPLLLQHLFEQARGIFIGQLLHDDTSIYIPVDRLPVHLSIVGTTGSGKTNLMQVMVHGVVDHNLEVIYSGLANTPRVAILAIDPHDDYTMGTEGRGLYHLADLLDPVVRKEIFGSYYYLYPGGTKPPAHLSSVSLECTINWEEISPDDLLNVKKFNPNQAEVLFSEASAAPGKWIENILYDTMKSAGHHAETVPAVRRRLRSFERSKLFLKASKKPSVLPEIVDLLESGKVLDFNCSLINDFEMFLFNTVVASIIFEIRKALKASTNMAEFKAQLQDRLPDAFWDKYKTKLDKYIRTGDDLKDPKEMPVVMFTIEEAPSILNPEMMEGQNIFKDIARQGRKFNICLAVISQQMSTLDNAIISNINTHINLPVGSDKERRSLVDNAANSITVNDLKALEGTLGVSQLDGNWLTKSQKILVPRYKEFFEKRKLVYSKYKPHGTSMPLI
ncbi:MAG: ATP-binding protein [Candidatus Sigynarchaeota archaeon]